MKETNKIQKPCCEKCEIYLDYKDSYQCRDGDCPCHSEEKRCKCIPIGVSGEDRDCTDCPIHTIRSVSPSDKKIDIQKVMETAEEAGKVIRQAEEREALDKTYQEVDEVTETINNGKYVEAHIVKELIISTVIKTKEEFYQKVKSVLAWVGNKESIRVLENLAKSENLNLEEPNK